MFYSCDNNDFINSLDHINWKMGKRIGKQYCKWNILFDSCKYNHSCIIYFCHNCLPDIKHYWDNSSYSIHCITSYHYYLSRYLCTWHDFKSKLQVFFFVTIIRISIFDFRYFFSLSDVDLILHRVLLPLDIKICYWY